MVQVLLAGILAMVISIVAGPKFIEFLRRNEFGQQIREEGPEGHAEAGQVLRDAKGGLVRRPAVQLHTDGEGAHLGQEPRDRHVQGADPAPHRDGILAHAGPVGWPGLPAREQ